MIKKRRKHDSGFKEMIVSLGEGTVSPCEQLLYAFSKIEYAKVEENLQ